MSNSSYNEFNFFNFRIIEHRDETEYGGVKYVDYYYSIHEVYYDTNGNPTFWTTNPVSIETCDDKDLKLTLKRLNIARKRTVLVEYNGKLVDTKHNIKQRVKLHEEEQYDN